MSRDLAIALVSGGMDSCVAAAVAAVEYELALLHVNYGQRTQRRELQSFEAIAQFFQVRRKLIADIGYLSKIGGSSLTDKTMPVEQADLDRQTIPSSYVPFRNTHFLAIGVSWAEVIGATKIFIGAVEPDSSGYPDCREAFYTVFNGLIRAGTRPETNVEVVAPLIKLKKAEIVRLGMKLGAPLHLTWSCYQNEDVPCGECDSCALRAKGFEQAGVADPILAPGRK
ncbi:MAG: 7-cyano-7-deazaguanine synthase QueC [Candidatus Abyssobacteria bacterium SURF_5]|uniref:7-cyano-7-deazaguanine synthase n=1 Tax=Abyssobacteria bacterium (strain SURF_5) TaxID=2093360 RepID=A0A3A4NVC1_ABYX5|nr:MAG: 7-cyano-7-deazaguanine synthase QueC [Candidatus Abyssubacteria bacterium SURF_5]